MKVVHTGQWIPVQDDPENRNRAKPAGGEDFKSYLQGEISAGVEKTARGPAGLEGPLPVSPVGPFFVPPSPPVEASALAGEMEGMLDRLQGLELGLARGELTPRRAVEALADMNREMEGLGDRLEALPSEHPLRRMGEEIRVLAYVESVKWNRGDYL